MPATASRTRAIVRTRAAALTAALTALTTALTARLRGGLPLGGLVAALVIGILGMHALTTYATAPDAVSRSSTADAAHEAAMAVGASHATHDHTTMASMNGTDTGSAMTADDTTAGSGHGTGHGSSHGLGGMVMLCVVMLAAAAVAVIALLFAGHGCRLRLKVFEPLAARVRTVVRIRDNRPPPAWEYSVIRC